MRARLIVFCGLPGVGKTAVARAVADALGLTFLRIDTIEAAIAATVAPLDGDPVGYVVAARVAADQLRAERSVVVDAVNDVQEARDGWIELAAGTGAQLRFVHVVCSDPVEHRRRVESRGFEMAGHVQPTWAQVQARFWAPWAEPRIEVDNIGSLDDAVRDVLSQLGL